MRAFTSLTSFPEQALAADGAIASFSSNFFRSAWIALMMATVLMLVNFIMVFGAVTLPHLASPAFLWVWVAFVISSLIVGGCGLANLIRGGFFKRLKERELRLKLMKSEQEHQKLPEKSGSASFDARSMPHVIDPVSVTETTTHELEANIKPTGETFRAKPPPRIEHCL